LVSHHLRILRDADLVETSKHRYWTYYRLRPDAIAALGRALIGLAKTAPKPGARRRPCC
jgi:ArsR family transcriptional regulator